MLDYMEYFPWGNPPENLALGVSIEDQKTVDKRVPILLQTPAAKRFVSIEPMLGPIDLSYPDDLYPNGPPMCCSGRECGCMGLPTEPPVVYGLDLVIMGIESGQNARPMHID